LKTSGSELRKFDSFTNKGKLKIDEICRKAAKVFSTKGFATATLSDVSRVVGISKGGIYHYSTPKPIEKIRIFIEHHICHYRDNLYASRLILHESQNLPPNYWEIIKDKQKEYLGTLRSAIMELIEGYEEKPEKANLVAYSLIGMCNWPYTWFDPKGKVTPEELAEEIYKIFVGDLRIRQSAK
jgi:hypothetical protein